MAKRSLEEYAEMSEDVERGDFVVSGPVEMGRTLSMGRPIGGGPPRGPSKSRSVRLPAAMDATLMELAVEFHVEPSELLRVAFTEFADRHCQHRKYHSGGIVEYHFKTQDQDQEGRVR